MWAGQGMRRRKMLSWGDWNWTKETFSPEGRRRHNKSWVQYGLDMVIFKDCRSLSLQQNQVEPTFVLSFRYWFVILVSDQVFGGLLSALILRFRQISFPRDEDTVEPPLTASSLQELQLPLFCPSRQSVHWLLFRPAHKSSFWARSVTVSASERKLGPTTPDQKTKRTTLRKSNSYLIKPLWSTTATAAKSCSQLPK